MVGNVPSDHLEFAAEYAAARFLDGGGDAVPGNVNRKRLARTVHLDLREVWNRGFSFKPARLQFSVKFIKVTKGIGQEDTSVVLQQIL